MKIIFMGTPEFAVPIFESIYNSRHKISCVFTQPPNKKFRGQKILESPIHSAAKKLNIEVKFPRDLKNNLKEFEFFKNSETKTVVVVAYGQIIPSKILNIPNLEFINIHASLLPKLRGAAPIQRSIMQMDNETGVTIMKIVSKLDAGPFMLQEKIKIEKDDNFSSLSSKLIKLGSKMILKTLDLLENGKAVYKDQNENEATYAKKIERTETEIKWNLKADKLVAKINALSPIPGAWFKHKETRFKVIKAEISDLEGQPGKVLNDELTIGCLNKSIKINLIQKEGKKILKAQEFLAGYKIKKNEILT